MATETRPYEDMTDSWLEANRNTGLFSYDFGVREEQNMRRREMIRKRLFDNMVHYGDDLTFRCKVCQKRIYRGEQAKYHLECVFTPEEWKALFPSS